MDYGTTEEGEESENSSQELLESEQNDGSPQKAKEREAVEYLKSLDNDVNDLFVDHSKSNDYTQSDAQQHTKSRQSPMKISKISHDISLSKLSELNPKSPTKSIKNGPIIPIGSVPQGNSEASQSNFISPLNPDSITVPPKPTDPLADQVIAPKQPSKPAPTKISIPKSKFFIQNFPLFLHILRFLSS